MGPAHASNHHVMSPGKTPLVILTCLLATPHLTRAVEVGETDCSLAGVNTQAEKMKGRALTQQELFKQSYGEAECLRQAAASLAVEWLETENLLFHSLKEADEGRWESALELVEKARLQAEQALRQAEHEAEAWKKRVID